MGRPTRRDRDAQIARGRVAARPRGPSAAGHRAGRPSDGLLVEASIVARLLGIRLLTLDATVALVPADVTPRTSSRGASPAGTPPRPPSVPPARSGATGRGLADAVRSINEGAELLAEARRNGP
jgi:hypothetical protein